MEWIKCSDRLPDFGVPVMVAKTGNPYIWTAMRDQDCEFWCWCANMHGPINDTDCFEADDDYDYDFWTPLPDPPHNKE